MPVLQLIDLWPTTGGYFIILLLNMKGGDANVLLSK